MYLETLLKKECCGCSACEQACPTNSISFIPDHEGFLYPSIDELTCIDCKLCEHLCPVEHPKYDNTDSPKVYAAMLKDVLERKRSSSGGLFYALATWIINQGGIVYGATIDTSHFVYHTGIDKQEGLHLLRGSKYVQSNLRQVFGEIKEILKNGRLCLFVGTGCQVAGLKSYLRKSYDNLVTADLVCHGVPSQWIFNQHILYLEKQYKGQVVDYQFRDNEGWGGCEKFKLVGKNSYSKEIRNPSYVLSPFLYSFMYGMISRESCYDCKFAKIPRQGDITLGDFWGVRKFYPDLKSDSGVSLLLLNNKKGEDIFEKIKHECEIRRSTLFEGAKYNGNLICAPQRHEIRDYIYNRIKTEGYSAVAKKEFRYSKYYYVKIKYTIRTIPVIKKLWSYMLSMRQKWSSFVYEKQSK